MNIPSTLLWGFAATLTLTTAIIAAQSAGLTRMDIPFVLGTMFTIDRDRAKVIGALFHLVNGWLFASVYSLFFENLHRATWYLGALMGLAQGTIVMVAVFPLLPGIHPRMVSDSRGPEPTRLLEPPGFLAMNYGRNTPVIILAAHLLYGLILGTFYTLSH
ncbi:MAG TPA: hypothetical protein VHL58_15550 [Thermoanaerobaculia bacterium]|nr:hypothetical protein [Thermoanaerobaculia bacterium]